MVAAKGDTMLYSLRAVRSDTAHDQIAMAERFDGVRALVIGLLTANGGPRPTKERAQ